MNKTIINVDKFRATISNKKESEAKYKVTIDNTDTVSTKSVKGLAITIDYRLRFDQHIKKFLLESCNTIEFVRWLQKYVENSEKIAIVYSFIYENLIIARWSGILALVNQSEKLSKFTNAAWE